jgi:hypothetical protein
MTIDEIRSLFRELSGRRNLSDASVDVYLTAGIRFLDDLVGMQHSIGRYIKTLAVGDYYVSFTNKVKVIERVTLYKDDTEVTQLNVLNINDLQTYAGDLISTNDQGLPTYFAIAELRRSPLSDDLSALNDKYAIIETGDPSSYNGIVFDIPVDYAYRVEIKGKFYSELEQNWWITNYELTTVHAALCKMEVGYRNTEGMKDWLASIKVDITEIDKNQAEQDSIGIVRMEG